jgi:hypothetical protein
MGYCEYNLVETRFIASLQIIHNNGEDVMNCIIMKDM